MAKNKRRLCLFFTLIFIFLLIAAPLFAKKKTTISFWHILGYHVKNVIEEMVDEYNDAYPHVGVKSDFQGFFEDAQVKMLTAAITKQLPDVAQIPFEFLDSYVENGFITSIDDEIPGDVRNDVMEKMWQMVSRNGKIYGLPFCAIADVFYYNVNSFREAGLDPTVPPATWDELVEMGKRLSRDSDGDGTIDEYAMTFYLNGVYGLAPLLWANGGSFLSEDGNMVNLTSQEMEKTVSMLHELVFTHKIMPRTWTDWESAQAFLMGKIAMGWFISAGISFNEQNLPWEFRVAHIPRFNGKRSVTLSGTALVNFAQKKKKRRAAWDFMLWLIHKENDIRMYERIGFLPIRKSSLNSLELKAYAKAHPNYKVPLEVLDYARPLPHHPEFLKINHEISNMLQRIMLEGADLREELKNTEKLINSMLD
jgi:sn-glycerol 3-phosphate transport system substrate-binding protein